MTAVIHGTGSYTPSYAMDNNDLAKIVETSDEWIRERTGVIRRHIIQEETTVSMAAEAARLALEDRGTRPEDIDLVKPEDGIMEGVVTHLIFKGVHYEMEVTAHNFEWLVHGTDMFPAGTKVGIKVDPFTIQIMKKPESEDEEAAAADE